MAFRGVAIAWIPDSRTDRVRNVCFLVDGEVLHPGDSLTRPPTPSPTLLLPVHAPWLRLWEAIDYVRNVRPERAYASTTACSTSAAPR